MSQQDVYLVEELEKINKEEDSFVRSRVLSIS